jgi:hypothetical protein
MKNVSVEKYSLIIYICQPNNGTFQYQVISNFLEDIDNKSLKYYFHTTHLINQILQLYIYIKIQFDCTFRLHKTEVSI